jgi:predicted nucleic acid-binding protein
MAMTVVIDASAMVDVVCEFPGGDHARSVVTGGDAVFAPAHIDAEAMSALGRLHRAGDLVDVDDRIEVIRDFPMDRLPLPLLLPLAWSLRERISLKDALYVALAITLDAALLTTDRRLARAAEGLVPLA